MKQFLFLATLLLTCSFTTSTNVVIDKQESLKAFRLLNEIRANPSKYIFEFPFLKQARISNKQLIWNDTLAKVAEAKAYDMASKNYYGHTDPDGMGINYYIAKSGYSLNQQWTLSKSDNNFESITAAVADGESAIKSFVIDKGVPSLGHRKHLLGMDDWNASLVDIGIGFARRDSGSTYKTYVSLIIAKHNW